MSYQSGVWAGAYLTPEELAKTLRVSRSAIYRSIANGRVRAVRLSAAGAFRVPVVELERLALIDGDGEAKLAGGVRS